MNRPDILLLNFRPDDGLGDALRAILEKPFGGARAKVSVRRFASQDARLAAVVRGPREGVTFLVLPAAPGRRAGELIRAVGGDDDPRATLIVVGAEEAGSGEMFSLLEEGAADFIVPPLKASEVLPRVWRLLKQVCPEEALRLGLKEKLGLRQFVGQSAAFLAEVRKIPTVARCDARILISGETGTGKELCARAIHHLSPRASKPFIPVNCGAIPSELIENELFGHERGAFTGAAASRHGLIREAEGGTLFLDEVDCLPPLAQVKLLRFLQEKEYRPLGSARMRRADVRVIAATNVNLEAAVQAGRVRQDFYYRLKIVPLRLPPLRERRADIALLARHFLSKYAAEFRSRASDFSAEAADKLLRYDWPGNVRELEHIVERAVMLSAGALIGEDDIDLPADCPPPAPARALSFQEAKAEVVEQFEREFIRGLLRAHHGNITKAAQSAHKDRRAFWQLIRKHQIDAQEFKG